MIYECCWTRGGDEKMCGVRIEAEDKTGPSFLATCPEHGHTAVFRLVKTA